MDNTNYEETLGQRQSDNSLLESVYQVLLDFANSYDPQLTLIEKSTFLEYVTVNEELKSGENDVLRSFYCAFNADQVDEEDFDQLRQAIQDLGYQLLINNLSQDEKKLFVAALLKEIYQLFQNFAKNYKPSLTVMNESAFFEHADCLLKSFNNYILESFFIPIQVNAIKDADFKQLQQFIQNVIYRRILDKLRQLNMLNAADTTTICCTKT